jgi:energy-coupling factor transport system permease protein
MEAGGKLMTFVLQMLETGKAVSVIHALDPRAKLLWWLCLIIVPILVTNPFILLFFTAWIWVMAYMAKIGRKMYDFLIVTYPVMVGFIMFTWPFFYAATPDQNYLFYWNFLHVSVEGLIYAVAMGMRIILALTACTFFVMTTDLMDLASGVGEFMQNKLHISYMYPLMVISSFKFLPELSGDYVTITDSFRSRGLEMDTGSLLEKLKKIIPIAIPLIDGMLRRAQSIAIALELKAFNASNKNRSFYKKHSFKGPDYLFITTGLLAILLSVLAVWLQWAKVELFL